MPSLDDLIRQLGQQPTPPAGGVSAMPRQKRGAPPVLPAVNPDLFPELPAGKPVMAGAVSPAPPANELDAVIQQIGQESGPAAEPDPEVVIQDAAAPRRAPLYNDAPPPRPGRNGYTAPPDRVVKPRYLGPPRAAMTMAEDPTVPFGEADTTTDLLGRYGAPVDQRTPVSDPPRQNRQQGTVEPRQQASGASRGSSAPTPGRTVGDLLAQDRRDRVYGGGRFLVYDPFLGREIRGRRGFEHVGRFAQQAFLPGSAEKNDQVVAAFRRAQEEGRLPLSPELSRDPSVRRGQLTELKNLQRVLDRYAAEREEEYKQARRTAPGFEDSPDPLASETKLRSFLAGKRLEQAKGFTPDSLTAYFRKTEKGEPTPYQRRHLASLAAAARLRYLTAPDVADQLGMDLLTGAFAELAGGGAAAAASGPVRQVLGRILPGKAGRVAARTGIVNRVVEGAVAGGIQQPATKAQVDPDVTPGELAAEAAAGALGGGLLGGAVPILGGAVKRIIRRGQAPRVDPELDRVVQDLTGSPADSPAVNPADSAPPADRPAVTPEEAAPTEIPAAPTPEAAQSTPEVPALPTPPKHFSRPMRAAYEEGAKAAQAGGDGAVPDTYTVETHKRAFSAGYRAAQKAQPVPQPDPTPAVPEPAAARPVEPDMADYTPDPYADRPFELRREPAVSPYPPRADSPADSLDAPALERTLPAGSLPTRPAPAPLPGGTTLTQSQAIGQLSKILQRHIKSGPQPRGVAGSYSPWNTRTVIKRAGDVSTALHEGAHALDDMLSLTKSNLYDGELVKFWGWGSEPDPRLSAPKQQVYRRAEGGAEWFRAWVINPDLARAEAPNLTRDAERAFETAGILRPLQDLSGELRKLLAADGLALTGKKIQMERPVSGPVQLVRDFFSSDRGEAYRTGLRDRVRAVVQDDLWPVMKAYRKALELRGVGMPRASKNAETRLRLFSGFNDRADAIFEGGMVDTRNNPVTPGGVKWLLEPLDHSDEAKLKEEMHLAASLMVSERVRAKHIDLAQKAAAAAAQFDPKDPFQRANRRRIGRAAREKASNLSGAGAGFYRDFEVAADARRRFAGLDSDTQARVREAADRYRQWADSVLDYYHAKGRIDADTYAAYKSGSEFYVDMGRVLDDDHPLFTGSRRLGSADRTATARFQGSTKDIENPFINLLENTYRMVREADRNEALNLFVRPLRSKRWLHEGRPVPLAEIGAQVGAASPKTITIYNRGREEYWEFERGIFEALKGWGEIYKPDLLMKLAMFPAKLIRRGVTLDPGFLGRNIIRDTVERAIKSEVGAAPWRWFRRYTPDDLAQFKLSGAGQAGHYLSGDPNHYYSALGHYMKELSGKKGTILGVPRAMGEAWVRLAEGTEQVGRVAEFQNVRERARKDGMTPFEADLTAALSARGLLDYAVAGTFTRKLNRIIPFTNPAVQGLARELQTVGQNPVRFLAKWTVIVLIPTVFEYLYNWRDEQTRDEFRQMEPHYKDLFWNFKVAPDSWLRVPKPYGFGVFASGVSRAVDSALGDKTAFTGYEKSVAKALLPIDEQAFAGPIRSIFEAQTNYNLLLDRPIISPYEAQLDVSRRPHKGRASRLGQAAEAAIPGQQDPRLVDYVIEGQGGGLGRLATDLSDVGRQDTPVNAPVKVANMATGLAHSGPVTGARDVQFVLQRARGRGEMSHSLVKELLALIDRYQAAKTPAERDRMGVAVRMQAAKARPYFEQEQPKKAGTDRPRFPSLGNFGKLPQ